MYTDGINEAMNPQGQQYTIDKIRAHVKKGAPELKSIGDAIVKEVLAHVGAGPQADDMCLVLMRRK